MNAQPFFVTGLPRSRTAWMANFLTWRDSFCHHDLLSECEHIDNLRGFLQVTAKDNDCQFVGTSDSGLCIWHRELLELFPAAKVVVIRRDPLEAAEDYARNFGQSGYGGVAIPPKGQLNKMFKGMDSILDEMVEEWPEGQMLNLSMAVLDHLGTMEELWKFLYGERDFPLDRWAMLDRLLVSPAPWKVTINQSRMNKLNERNPLAGALARLVC